MRSRQLIVDQRQVEHEIVVVIETAAVRAGQEALEAALGLGQVGLVGDQFHRAAHGARAVQRTLRAAQHFDAIQVIERRIDDDLAVLGTRRCRHRDVVEIEADRRGVTAAGGHAAHLDLGLARAVALERDARRGRRQRRDIADTPILQILPAHRRDADGGFLHRRGALLRGHDDLGEPAAGILRSRCGLGARQCCKHAGRARE